MFRERETLEHSILNGLSPLNPSPQGLGVYLEKEVKRLQEPEALDDSKEIVSPKYNRTMHVSAQRLWPHAQPAHAQPDSPKPEREVDMMACPEPRSCLQLILSGRGKISFS